MIHCHGKRVANGNFQANAPVYLFRGDRCERNDESPRRSRSNCQIFLATANFFPERNEPRSVTIVRRMQFQRFFRTTVRFDLKFKLVTPCNLRRSCSPPIKVEISAISVVNSTTVRSFTVRRIEERKTLNCTDTRVA